MDKVLIANRGEIAVRVIRTLRKMGIKSLAVFSEVDRIAKHVKLADEAVCIGPAPSSQSYLLADKIVEVAIANKVDGIHPGYGFLSENAEFAKKVTDNGMIFIGPSPRAIEIMGSKLAAKDAVKAYNIPMVPGVDSAVTDITEAKTVAAQIGYPILIKASAGGGGKGMRVVEHADEFESQMDRAQSEAISAFGDGSVFIEKYVGSSRHIEIQVLADNYGNTIHLFERDCSIQRRHQKVVEEAPSVALSEELRQKMGAAAVQVAKACEYSGAGTVEFLLDESNDFYFLEMNTRLQVEHPVTELITNVDLVEQQIKIARGEKLTIAQDELRIDGHALELRVYAEDPSENFLPNVGKLEVYQVPIGEGVRVDDGYEQGVDIPIYYDPLIAKLIVKGPTRKAAIAMMKKAISEYEIKGVKTTLAFGSFVCDHPAFVSGKFDTNFVKRYFSNEKVTTSKKAKARIAAHVALKSFLQDREQLIVSAVGNPNWSHR